MVHFILAHRRTRAFDAGPPDTHAPWHSPSPRDAVPHHPPRRIAWSTTS